jgi:hypothetical protein
MRAVTRFTIASVLLLSALGAVSFAATSTTQNSTPPVAVEKTQLHPIGPVTVHGHGPIHTNYECKMNSCTCVGASDCGTMGADHVCMEGTFRGDAVGGSCTEKKV